MQLDLIDSIVNASVEGPGQTCIRNASLVESCVTCDRAFPCQFAVSGAVKSFVALFCNQFRVCQRAAFS
jgi:hypothetical protein